MKKPEKIKVILKLPLVEIEGTWMPNENEQQAAWEMYVELITRIAVAELGPAEGFLREALSSLYSLFETTRNILRNYGPAVATPQDSENLSFGYLAVAILNLVLRPLLSQWHPLLSDYENKRGENVMPLLHEQNWDKAEELRQALNKTRLVLVDYANLLAQVAGVPSLIVTGKNVL